jgi:hypothetical protein
MSGKSHNGSYIIGSFWPNSMNCDQFARVILKNKEKEVGNNVKYNFCS